MWAADNPTGWLGVTHNPKLPERPYQAKLVLNTGEAQTALGNYSTPLEAARAVAKAKRGEIEVKEKGERLPRGSAKKRCVT